MPSAWHSRAGPRARSTLADLPAAIRAGDSEVGSQVCRTTTPAQARELSPCDDLAGSQQHGLGLPGWLADEVRRRSACRR